MSRKARPQGRRSARRGKAGSPRKGRASSGRRGTPEKTYDDSALSPDRVVCRLCGETYKAIRVSHLRAVHGFEGEHPVEDYKRRFGLRVAASEEVCKNLRDQRVQRAIRDGQHWTRAKIRAQLRQKARAGLPLAYCEAPMRLQLAATRLFGNWDAALEFAGFDPKEHRIRGRWSATEVVREIEKRREAGQSLAMSVVSREQPELYTAARKHCGSWRAAMRASGLSAREHGIPRLWERGRAEAWVRERVRTGRSILASHVPQSLRAFASREGRGGWIAYVESLGVPYPGVRKRLDWSDAAVLREIRRRKRLGKALNLGAVQADGQALTHQARNRFGSWDRALKAAGIDPKAVRLARPWTRADVIDAIRARARAGKPMRRVDATADEPRLVKAATAAFPHSWTRALRAAGIESAKPTPRRTRAAHSRHK